MGVSSPTSSRVGTVISFSCSRKSRVPRYDWSFQPIFGGVLSISAMYHSFRPSGATWVSSRISMVSLDQATHATVHGSFPIPTSQEASSQITAGQVARCVTQRQGPSALRISVGELQANDATEGLAHENHPVDTLGIQELHQVSSKSIQ